MPDIKSVIDMMVKDGRPDAEIKALIARYNEEKTPTSDIDKVKFAAKVYMQAKYPVISGIMTYMSAPSKESKLDQAIDELQLDESNTFTKEEMASITTDVQLAKSGGDEKIEELETRLKEVPSMSQEGADISKEIEEIKTATAESLVNPNLKTFQTKVDLVNVHEEKINEIKERVEATGGNQEEVDTAVSFYEENADIRVKDAIYDVQLIEDGLEEITSAEYKDTYSGFGKKDGSFNYIDKEEQLELDNRVRQQIIENLSIKDFGRAVVGNYTLEEKENIINNAKYTVLDGEVEKAEKIWNSASVVNFANKKRSLEERISAMSKYDDEGLLMPFETQEEVDRYNDLAKQYDNLEAEQDSITSMIDGAQDKLKTAHAELGFHVNEGVFNNNFKMTDQYEHWRDKHLKSKGSRKYRIGVLTDAVGTFIQEGLNVASDATLGTSLWIGGWLHSKSPKGKRDAASKYYGVWDAMDDWYKKYTTGNWLGVSDKDADILDEDGNFTINARSATKTFAEMLPFTVGIIMAAKNGNPKPAKNLWSTLAPKFVTSTKGRSNIRMMRSTMAMTGIDNYYEGKELGLDKEKAYAYSAFKSFGEALVQAINPDTRFLGTSTGKVVLNGVVNNLKGAATKKAVGIAVARGLGNIVREIPEELIQVATGDLAKLSVGLQHSPDILDERVIKETIASTIILGGGLAPVGAINNYSNVKKQVYTQYKERGQEIMDAISDDIKVAEAHLKKAKTKGAKVQFQTIIDQLTEAKNYGQSIVNAVKSAPGGVSDVQIDLLIEKQKLVKQKEGLDKAAAASIDEQIKELDVKIADSAIRQREVKETEKIKTTIKTAIEESKLEGGITEVTGQEISEDLLEREAELRAEIENSKDKKEKAGYEEELKAISRADKEYGFIAQAADGSFEIFLNKDKPMVGTAAHEFMHAVLNKTIGANKVTQDNLGDALIEHVLKLGGDKSILGKRLSAYGEYNKKGEFIRGDNFGEETITIMSESIIDGSLKFEESFFTKIGDIIRRFSQNVLGKEITFDTGRDVYNFVKDYSKSVKEGKISKAILKVAKEGAKGKLVEGKVEAKPTVKMSKAITEQLVEDQSFENKIQDLYEKGDLDAIQEAYKPRIKRILRSEWSWTEDNESKFNAIIEEAVGPDRGILQLIIGPGKTKYDPARGVPLSGHIGSVFQKRGEVNL